MLSPRRARVVFACALALCLALAAATQVEQPGDYEEVRFPPEQILQEQNRAIDRANFMIARDEAKPLYHHAPMDIAQHMPRSSHGSPFDGELYDGGQDASFAQESVSAEPTPVPVPSAAEEMPSDELPGQYTLPMQQQEEAPSRVAQRGEPRVRGGDAAAEFRFRDRSEYQPQPQQQQEQPHQHHVLTRQAVLGHVARTFFHTALHHLNAEMIELEAMAGQEVVEGHHKRTRAHRTTRLMNQPDDDDDQAFLEESTTVVAAERSSVAQKKSKVIEKLHLMTLPKNMRLPTAAEKFMPAIAAPTETIELEIDPVVKSTNGHRKVLTDKEDTAADNQPAVSLPSETQDNTLRQSSSHSSSTSRSSARSGKDQRDAGSDDDGEGDDDDDDDDDDDGSSAKDGGLKLIEEGDHATTSLFAEKTDAAEEEAMFKSEPREADSMNGIGKVADNKQFDSFLQAQAQTRAERAAASMRMRSRRGFVKSAFNAVKGAVQKGVNFVKGVLGGNKPQAQQQQQQGQGGKKTPQDIEDCVGCKLVWSQVEMDVGNARYIEDVQASFEHNCMDAQKSTIFYEACEDMYDDMYAMTDDYMSNKFPVAAMCARAKMCQS